jgi:hypothetical protein
MEIEELKQINIKTIITVTLGPEELNFIDFLKEKWQIKTKTKVLRKALRKSYESEKV